MQFLKVLRNLVAFQAGVFLSASVTLLACIVLAVHLNYFSGRNPASLVLELPWFLLLANVVGGALLSALRLLRVRPPHDACTYLILGLVLGLAPAGLALNMLIQTPVAWAISTGIVLAACFVVLLGGSTREAPAVAGGA